METVWIVSFVCWLIFAYFGKGAGKMLGTRALFSMLEFGFLAWVIVLGAALIIRELLAL